MLALTTDVERWADGCLLYLALVLVCTVPVTAYGAQGEGPDGPRRPYRPGTVVHKQVKITLPAQEFGDSCQATVNLRFTQADKQADVRTEIVNEDCAASSGEYELRLRIKDDDGAETEFVPTETEFDRLNGQACDYALEYRDEILTQNRED